MNVVETGRDETMRPILRDENTLDLVDVVAPEKRLRAFLMSVIRDFPDHRSLTDRNPNLRKFANNYATSRAELNAVDRVCRAIERLYDDFDESHVRGALLEALIQRSVQTRYGAADDVLDNNIEFRVERDGASHVTSTSVDVLGVDTAGELGECHDCKVRAKKLDLDWLKELQDDLAPFGFRIGIATAGSARVARRDLQKRGFQIKAATTLIAEDNWVLPLQP